MDPLIIPIVGILMPLVLVPSVLVLKHRHKRREWEHRERMRAMEGPMPLARSAGAVGSGGVAAIGAGVPMASVLAAFLTGLTWEPTTPDDVPIPAVAWGCAVLISAGGLHHQLRDLAHLQARTQTRARTQPPPPRSTPRSRSSTRMRSTWWGAGVEATRPVWPLSHRVKPAAPQIAIKRLERDVEPGRDDRQGVEQRDRRRGGDRRQQPPPGRRDRPGTARPGRGGSARGGAAR